MNTKKIKEALYKYGRKLNIIPSCKETKKRDEFGREIPDPKPIELILKQAVDNGGVKSQTKIFKEMLHAELTKEALRRGYETPDEANDFEVSDDETIWSGYEEMPGMAEEAEAMINRTANPENTPPEPVIKGKQVPPKADPAESDNEE